ncbi:MAG: hypothetical protein AAF378_22390 [Cyanobacteria bacterium P01_A01_bin.84]
MVNRVNDITWQAHQGSVAAIIQVLNEKLANSGVRTRAIFDNGVLQLLCEAHTTDKLKQSDLVQQVQQTLEFIAPRNIRRVNINSRIVREQQLLWLKDISRNPKNQLLWSQEILLDKPSKRKQVMENFQEIQKSNFPQSLSSEFLVTDYISNKSEISFFRGMIFLGGMMFSALIAWRIYTLFENQFSMPISQKTAVFINRDTDSSRPQISTENLKRETPVLADKVYNRKSSQSDNFAEAIRIANKTSLVAQTAKTKQEWLRIATEWQKASDLMSNVAENDRRYKLAQNRVELYREYSQIAQNKADKN